MLTLITSKGTDIDENIANQNHATRTRTPKPGYLNLSITNFNDHQKNAIRTILEEKRDVFVNLPTGFGKSIIFQA